MSGGNDDAWKLALAERLTECFAARDVAGFGELYTDDVEVWHNHIGKTESRAENLSGLKAMFELIVAGEYRDIRRSVTPEGFVQQHVTRLTLVGDIVVEIPMCMVARVRDGRISRLDEYADPAPFLAAMQAR